MRYLTGKYWAKRFVRFSRRFNHILLWLIRVPFFGKLPWSATIMPGCEFKHCSKIFLSKKSFLGRGCIVHAAGKQGIVIGKNSSVSPYCTIQGNVEIGDFVMVGPNTMLSGANHKFDRIDVPMIKQGGTHKGGILICDDVWIGANCVITDGIKIGTGSIIAGGAVVTKDVEAYSIMAGVPAVKIRSRKEQADN